MSVYAPWNTSFYYTPGEIVSYNAADYRATSEQPNQGNQPDISTPTYWTVYSNGGINVVSAINAGPGITVDGSQTADPTISLNLEAGLGTSIQNSGPGTTDTISVVIDGGDGIEITAVAGPGGGIGDTVVVNNTGVLSLTQGSGITVANVNQNIRVDASIGEGLGFGSQNEIINTGVLSLGVSTGLQNTGTATNPVLSTVGNPVQSVSAGTGGISITGASTTPTVNNTTNIQGLVGANVGFQVVPAISSSSDGNGNWTISPNLFPWVGNFLIPTASPNFNFTYPGQYFISAIPLNVGDLQLGFNLYQTSSKPGRYWVFNNNGVGNNNMNVFAYIYGANNTQYIIANGVQLNPGQGIVFDLVYTPNIQNPSLNRVSLASINGANYAIVNCFPNNPTG